MSLISRPVPLHDIADAEAFVRAAINKAGAIVLTRDEREELVAEGLVILCDLARRYQPRMNGHKRDGSFAGYASNLLRKKLSDAYHGARENHLLRTQPDGTRRYEYLPRADSLDSKLTGQPGPRFSNDGQLDESTIRRPGNFIAPPVIQAAG